MLVKDFMVKAKDVVKCSEWDPIMNVIDAVLEKHISSVVVVDKEGFPVGIVTKTDLVRGYQKGVSLHQKVGVIMAKELKTVPDTLGRDDASKTFERNEIHHAVVVDKEGKFAGLISSLDIASEVAKDSRAWPWNRTPDGRIAGPTEAH